MLIGVACGEPTADSRTVICGIFDAGGEKFVTFAGRWEPGQASFRQPAKLLTALLGYSLPPMLHRWSVTWYEKEKLLDSNAKP